MSAHQPPSFWDIPWRFTFDLLADYLTGPVAVEGAEPGDALCVEILNIEYYESMPWGYTGVFEKADGGLFATRFDTKAAKAIWDFEGRFCSSRHIPGVRFAGITHPGIIACSPSQELLDEWNRREQALIDAHPGASPPVALAPEPKNAYVGQDVPKEVMEKIAREGARTVPGREHGGNCDSKTSFLSFSPPLTQHLMKTGSASIYSQEPLDRLEDLAARLYPRREPLHRRLALLTRRSRTQLLRGDRDGRNHHAEM